MSVINIAKLKLVGPLFSNPLISTQWHSLDEFDQEIRDSYKVRLDALTEQMQELFSQITTKISGQENDQATRSEIFMFSDRFCNTLMGNQTIHMYDYRPICDARNNSPNIVEDGLFAWDCYFKLTQTIPYIRYAIEPIDSPT